MYEFASAIVFGFFLGLRHATEPDHVLTVSAIVSQTKDKKRAALTGLFWGIGHTATLFLLVLATLTLHLSLPSSVFKTFEVAVGVILVLLGVRTIMMALTLHSHEHTHKNTKHIHPHAKGTHHHQKTFLIGAVHGLAGSGSIIVLVAATFQSAALGLLYVLFLGIGSIVGMVLFTKVLNLSFIMASSYLWLFKLLTMATGALSIVIGTNLIKEMLF